MTKIKKTVAVIGAGYFARLHIDAWRRIEDVALVAICDRDLQRAQNAVQNHDDCRSYTDAHELLAAIKPDIVDIATPPDSHLSLVQLACGVSNHVICQKPLAPTYAEASAIVAAAATSKSTLVVHENVRFMPWHREIKEIISSGKLGRLLSLGMRLRPGDGQGPEAYLDRQPYFQKMPRFLVHETAIHWIDTFRFLAGEPSGVFARLATLNPAIAGEDSGIIVFDMADGCRAVFDGNRLLDHESDNPRRTMGELSIEGTMGALRLNGRGQLFIRERAGAEQEWQYSWNDRDFGGDCVYRFQRHVVDSIVSGQLLENTGADYLRNIEIEERIYQSAQQGRWLEL